MPYKKPLRKTGIAEPHYWHFIKLCWFIVHFEDIQDEISIRKFCREFKEIVINKGIIEKVEQEFNLEWDWWNEDGTHKEPDYDKLMNPKSKPKKYGWYTQYPVFKTDRLQSLENSEREKFIRNIPNLAKSCYTTIQHCEEREDWFKMMEDETGKPFDYPRNKNTDTKRNEVELWMDIIGLNKEEPEIPEDAPNVTLPIVDNPVWLDKNALAARNAFIWENLPKRGEG